MALKPNERKEFSSVPMGSPVIVSVYPFPWNTAAETTPDSAASQPNPEPVGKQHKLHGPGAGRGAGASGAEGRLGPRLMGLRTDSAESSDGTGDNLDPGCGGDRGARQRREGPNAPEELRYGRAFPSSRVREVVSDRPEMPGQRCSVRGLTVAGGRV